MLNRHVLSLEAPDTANAKIFRLVDTSSYSGVLKVDCERLEILVPGYNTPVTIEVTKGFNLSLTSIDLTLSSNELLDLPDGLYIVRYSVSPNDKVYVEYNILRVTGTMNCYMNQLCRLRIGACEPPPDVKEKWKDLAEIRNYIEAAKIKTEWCGDGDAGIALLTYADKLLAKYAENHCTNC